MLHNNFIVFTAMNYQYSKQIFWKFNAKVKDTSPSVINILDQGLTLSYQNSSLADILPVNFINFWGNDERTTPTFLPTFIYKMEKPQVLILHQLFTMITLLRPTQLLQ